MTVLHWIGDLIRDTLAQIPLPLVRILFIAIPVVLLLWVLTLPTRTTKPPDDTASWGSNLKIWAVLALLFQIAIYAMF